MKKVLLLLVAVSFSFVSCDKNDDNQVVAETSPIHGKWEVKTYDSEVTLNGEPFEDGEIDFEDIVGTVFEFKGGNKFSVSSYNDEEGKWETDEGTYVYHTAQNKVDYTMVDPDGTSYTQTMSVKLLNSTNLNFNITSEEQIDENYVFKLSLDLNCEKVK